MRLTAIQMLPAHLPLGIGPGQFGALGLTEKDLAHALPPALLTWLGFDLVYDPNNVAFGHVPIKYLHNTFVAMILEWGVLGVAFSALLVLLVWKTIRSLSPLAASCYAVYLFPTLLLHDGLGFRVHSLILGIGVAAWLGQYLKRHGRNSGTGPVR